MLLTLLGPQPSGAVATKLDTQTEHSANNLTFSNGDLTATTAVSGGSSKAWTLDKVGKSYLEATLDATAGGWQGALGLILSNKAFTSWGGDTDSFGVMADGTIWLEGVSQGDLGGDIGVGGVLCMAVDRANNLVWVRHNSGNWNGSGTANPATGTGGISISGLPAGNLFIGVYLDVPIGAAMTIRPTAAEWTIGAPAGFTAIAGTTYPAFPASGAVAYDEVPYPDTWTTGVTMAWLAGQNDPYGGSRAVRYYSTSSSAGQMGNHSTIWNVSHTYTNGEPYTAEIEAKADGAQYIRVCHYDGGNDWGVIFDLVNGTVGSLRAGGGTETNASITSLGDGWYRCRFDFLGDTTWQNYQLAPTNTNSTDFDANTTLAAGDGILLFRFQTYPAVATISASASQALGLVTQTANASTGGSISASASQTLDLPTQTATAAVTVAASASQTLDLVTVAETGTAVVAASAAQTLELVTVAETGTVVVAASASQTLDLVTQAATANASNSVNASASQTLALPTQTATAGVTVAASASQTLDLVTVAETGAVLVGASATQGLQLVSQAATGTVVDGRAASADQTLALVTQTATGVVVPSREASASQTLALVTQTATGVVVPSREASASQTLPLLTAAATSTVRVAANGNQTLDLPTQAATGTAALGPISASATQTLSPPTQIVSILLWVTVPDATGSWTPVGDATGGWADTAGPSGTWIDAA
jgi:hypothetical protein